MTEQKIPGSPDPGQPEKGDRLDQLIGLATGLNQEVDQLASRSGRQFVSLSRTARTNRRLIFGVITGGLLDVVLTVVLGFIGVGMAENTHRIDELTQKLSADNTAQRQRALCPLYGIFKDSQSAAGRAAAGDKTKYDHSYEVINDGYTVLGCDAFLKESGRDKW